MRQRPSGHKRVAAGRNNGLQTTASERGLRLRDDR